jgi:hypothetical protein
VVGRTTPWPPPPSCRPRAGPALQRRRANRRALSPTASSHP